MNTREQLIAKATEAVQILEAFHPDPSEEEYATRVIDTVLPQITDIDRIALERQEPCGASTGLLPENRCTHPSRFELAWPFEAASTITFCGQHAGWALSDKTFGSAFGEVMIVRRIR